MLKSIISLTLVLITVTPLSPCEPFGLRIYYGDMVISKESQERLAIYFNTKQSCPNSFITLLSNEGFKKIICISKPIKTSSFVNFYTTYVQICSINDVPFEQTISYTAYGWDLASSINPTPFKQQWISVKLADPRPKDRDINLVVLADWGAIETSLDTLIPITKDLKKQIEKKQINGIIIAGDIAYDLDSNNGSTYEKFLIMMQEFSSIYPFFIVPGNHERKNPDAALLFNESFKSYGVSTKLAGGISFGSLYLTLFDPYNIIYNQKEAISSLDALKIELAKGQQSGRFILPYSHYPLICSVEYQTCYDGFVKLQPYFDAMIDSGVSLYVGAHAHAYERNYPYYKDHSFLQKQSPYTFNGKYLISVVQGVAGNDHSFFTVMPEKKYFNAKYTVSQTGFAILQSKSNYVTYSHFSTKQGFMDEFKIIKKDLSEDYRPKLRSQDD